MCFSVHYYFHCCYVLLLLLWQANYGGVTAPLPKSMRGTDEEEEEEEEDDEGEDRDGERENTGGTSSQDASAPMEGEGQGGGALDETWGDISFTSNKEDLPGKDVADKREVKMNWHICNYLPEDGSCRSCFQVG